MATRKKIKIKEDRSLDPIIDKYKDIHKKAFTSNEDHQALIDVATKAMNAEYKPKSKTPWISTTIQYLVLILIGFLLFRGCDYHHLTAPRLTISPYMVIPVGLSLAYLWTNVWKIGVTKPFNCINCLTGWFSLIIALVGKVDNWYFYAPLGVFIASIYSSIRMRYL